MSRAGTRRRTPLGRWLAPLLIVLLYLLHNDWWLWDEAGRVFGLPAGLAYHVGYCLVTAALMAWLVRGFDRDGGGGPS